MTTALILFSRAAVLKGMADDQAFSQHINEGATRQGLEVHAVSAFYDDLLHVIDGGRSKIIDTVSGKDIASFDVVYQRRWGDMPAHALACAIYLKKKNVKCIDEETFGVGSRNKLTQAWRLWEADLPHPATVYADRAVDISLWLAETATWNRTWPLILKGIDGTRGSDNYLVKDRQALDEKLQQYPDTRFELQHFVPNDGDYRVLVCGDKVELVMYRKAQSGTHLNNTSRGGEAELVDISSLDDRALHDSVSAAQAFGRNIAGVDLVYDKETGLYYFFEVNRSPQIETGQYVGMKSEAVARYLAAIKD